MIFAFGIPTTGSLILMLVVVWVLFSTKRLRRNAGKDSGKLIKSFVPLRIRKD